MSDSTGEWEVVGRPYTTAGGKNANVRVQRVDKPGVTEVRMWGAYEKVSVESAPCESADTIARSLSKVTCLEKLIAHLESSLSKATK